MASILQKLQYFFFGHQIERSVNRTEQSPNLYTKDKSCQVSICKLKCKSSVPVNASLDIG